MKNTSKFQNVVIVTIVGWLVLFVFLPNLMIIGTSFLTRDDASFVKMVFTLDNYTRLLDPLYFEVLLHSLNMALIATLACLVLGYPFAWFLAKLPHKVRPLLLFLLIVPFWTNSLINHSSCFGVILRCRSGVRRQLASKQKSVYCRWCWQRHYAVHRFGRKKPLSPPILKIPT